MGGCGSRGKCLSAFSLLLLWGTVATALPLESGPTGRDSVEATEGTRNGLLAFLAWCHEWTSQASSSALMGADASKVKRQESPPLRQPPGRDKKPCKNFFWKTFSSCK